MVPLSMFRDQGPLCRPKGTYQECRYVPFAPYKDSSWRYRQYTVGQITRRTTNAWLYIFRRATGCPSVEASHM
jgi:hypothetical protein